MISIDEKPFGWLFVGAGNMAQNSAKSISKSNAHRIIGFYNRTYEKGCEVAKKFNTICYHTLQEALAAEGVEGVYIASTAESHFSVVMECLEKKKPVLIEKPFTVTAKDAEILRNKAEEQGVFIAEAMWTWYSPVAHQVKYWLDTGAIGALQKAEFFIACR